MLESWHDECGIVGVFNHQFASKLAFLGIHAQQHRGQEHGGICTPERIIKGEGLITEVFKGKQIPLLLPGRIAIGHNRYSTQGENDIENAAPFVRETSYGRIAVVHNGHIINYDQVRSFLAHKGLGFNSFNDGELHLQLVAYRIEQNGGDYIEAVCYLMKKMRGAYSIILMTPDGLIVYRDPYGFRPVSIGIKNNAIIVASETCALEICGARYEKDVKPGEIVSINKKGIQSFSGCKTNYFSHCIFELIYFARPDSRVFGISVCEFRELMGRRMAQLLLQDKRLQQIFQGHKKEDIIFCPVPDTALDATQKLCQQLGLSDQLEFALIRSHYAGRTFIEPEQVIRDFSVKLKYAAIRKKIKGKVVVLVDDSIVRGSTLRKIVQMIRKAGARKVIIIIYSPQIKGPCHMGIDTPDFNELIANTKGGPCEVAKHLTADCLLHCKVSDLKAVVERCGQDPRNFCYACFDRRYALRVPRQVRKTD